MRLNRLQWLAAAAMAVVSFLAVWPLTRSLARTQHARVDAQAQLAAREQLEAVMVTLGNMDVPKDVDAWTVPAIGDPIAYSKSNVQPPLKLMFSERDPGLTSERFRQGGYDYLAVGRVTKKGEGVATVIALNGWEAAKSGYTSMLRWRSIAWVLLSGAFGWWMAGQVIRPTRQALSERRGFLADAAHEMRTPLAIILASASQSLARPRSSEDYVRSMAEIRAAAERASAGVNELLDLARLESGQAMPRLAPLRLDLLAEEVAASTRAEGVTVTAEPASAAVVVDADLSLLRQAVDNLVRNAARRAKNVSLESSIDGRDGVVTVLDDGPGFDPAILPHVFDRYRRGDSRGEVGLGLALVQTIVAAHGGAAKAENRPEGGAAVTLRIPLSRPSL